MHLTRPVTPRIEAPVTGGEVCPHPESRALSSRLHDGIRSCPSDQTPSCDGVTSGGGFSLIELAIVLVILGLLVGGIMTGQSLIRAAELRSVTTELQGYQAAVGTFRDKYFAIPGDMSNATAFWGKDNTNCPTHTGTAATPGTCNGNANGLLEYPAAASTTGEAYQFWNQLAQAGLVEGTYSGITGSGAFAHSIIGTNVPRSRLSNAGWTAEALGGNTLYGGDDNRYQLIYGNGFSFGSALPTTVTVGKVLKPEEAWKIDTKMDDGKPASGKVIAVYWSNMCAAADDGSSAMNDLVASYRLTDSTAQCALYFTRLF